MPAKLKKATDICQNEPNNPTISLFGDSAYIKYWFILPVDEQFLKANNCIPLHITRNLNNAEQPYNFRTPHKSFAESTATIKIREKMKSTYPGEQFTYKKFWENWVVLDKYSNEPCASYTLLKVCPKLK